MRKMSVFLYIATDLGAKGHRGRDSLCCAWDGSKPETSAWCVCAFMSCFIPDQALQRSSDGSGVGL